MSRGVVWPMTPPSAITPPPPQQIGRTGEVMAFAAVERLIAFRYLRARREEGFISVIAGFSLVGIALGVGTLIVVMAVMNGFQIEMLRQMAGISGQLGVQGNARRAAWRRPT